MDRKQIELITKIHNELLKRKRINADKYEREDLFFGVKYDMANGKSMKDAFIDSFKAVYGVEISDMLYESCYHLCKGWN